MVKRKRIGDDPQVRFGSGSVVRGGGLREKFGAGFGCHSQRRPGAAGKATGGLAAAACLVILLVTAASGISAYGQFTLSTVYGTWISADDSPTGLGTNELRWGIPSGQSQKSGYRFLGSSNVSFGSGEVFVIGTFNHLNFPVTGETITRADLQVRLQFSTPPISPDPVFTFRVLHEETPNERPCAYPGSTVCPDRVRFQSATAQETYLIGGIPYTLEILGFRVGSPTGPTVSEFITEERQENLAYLVGRLVVAAVPSIELVKTGTLNVGSNGRADAGDTISYTFAVTNTGNVALTNVKIDDARLGVANLAVAPATLGPGEQGTAQATYAISQSDLDAGSVYNVATVTGTPPSGPSVSDTDDDTQTLTRVPSIELVKTGTLNVGSNGRADAG
ncbi:MAG TPA: THxN family PEP-CTERM protein, partial [Candidatus Bipolaricaulis sp.]|nr:THxN family PEP-CTERM protein [Candidatus Bipolaricaulis sp.]